MKGSDEVKVGDKVLRLRFIMASSNFILSSWFTLNYVQRF